MDLDNKVLDDQSIESKETISDAHILDFKKRWIEKFGEPQTRTLPGDQFMKRLKEIIEFE